MDYLAHMDKYGEEPYGVWWLTALGSPDCVYAIPSGAFETRGRMVMYSKPEGSDWVQWMRHLANVDPVIERWVRYDNMGMSPSAFLDALAPDAPTTLT